VIPGALDSLLRLQTTFDLVVVTSRQHVIQTPTLEWIERHFPGVFSDVHFGNHFALEGSSRPKSEICRAIGAQVLIDDNPRYAEECAAAGIQVLLYDWDLSYPWSKTPEGPTHERIARVTSWQEVEAALGAMAPLHF
jgi:5'(3')-deoxyribonucleotidase